MSYQIIIFHTMTWFCGSQLQISVYVANNIFHCAYSYIAFMVFAGKKSEGQDLGEHKG
jgi:hypothetical protein